MKDTFVQESEPIAQHVELNPTTLEVEQLVQASTLFRSGEGLPPATVSAVLATDLSQEAGLELDRIDKIAPAALLAGHIATLSAVNYTGKHIPSFGHLPYVLHTILQSVHNLSVNAASSTALRDHIPFLFLEASVSWGALRTARQFFRRRGLKATVVDAQTEIRNRVDAGTMQWSLPEGSTIAFVGNGDPLADELSSMRPDDFLQIAHNKVSGSWTKLEPDASRQAMHDALKRANIEKAGEIMVLPIVHEHEFLPGPNDHDMSIDEIVALISAVDEYCDNAMKTDETGAQIRGIERKRIIVVGSKKQTEHYGSRYQGEDATQEAAAVTLEDRLTGLTKDRGAEIDIIDPTELIINKITKLAEGKRLGFFGTQESVDIYGERFLEALEEQGYRPTDLNSKVRVLYNVTDFPTANHAGAMDGDIAVILDPTQKQVLLSRGMPEERIIVVPEELIMVANTAVSQS